MAQQDDGLLREVEEELRRERLEKIWKQYGTYIVAAAAAIVFGVLGFKYWESSRLTAAQEAGARYEEAMLLVNDKKEGSAEKEFEKIAVDGAGGYRALAQLQLAGSQAKQGKKAEARRYIRGAGQRRQRRRDAARLCPSAGRRPAHRRGRLYRDRESAHPSDGRHQLVAL